MKTIDRSSPAEVTGDIQSRNLSIEANGKAFKELISGIYADKAYAIARETIANGVDSHVQAGIPERPVRIHMPTLLEPHYSIRDYGVSMTHDMVMELYSTLFRSTKDDPNSDESNKYVGKFGLGSKSPFAYTDAFQLTTYLDGTQRVYDIFFNGGMPKIALLLEADTDEENGVLVSFGVDSKDAKDFERAIKRAVEGLDVLPEFEGTQPTLHQRTVKAEGKGWKLLDSTQSGKAEARQGTVLYPLNEQAVINLPQELSPLFSQPFRFDFEIGTLDVVTSREALSYDKETSDNIIARLQEVLDEIRQRIKDDIAQAQTYWEFSSAYYKALDAFPERVFGKVSQVQPTFKGRKPLRSIEVKTNNVHSKVKYFDEDLKVEGEKIVFHARFGTMSYCKISAHDMRNKVLNFRPDRDGNRDRITLDVSRPLIVVVEDMREKNRYPAARIKTLVETLPAEDKQESQMLWIRHYGDSQYVMNRLFVAFGRPQMKLFNLLDVPHVAPPRTYFSGPRSPYKVLSSDGEWKTPADDAEMPAQAWYVPMRNGSVDTSIAHLTERRMAEVKALFVSLGDEDLPIVGIPASSRKIIKQNPDWVSFYDYVAENVNALFDQDQYNNYVFNAGYHSLPDLVDYLQELMAEKAVRPHAIEAFTGSVLMDIIDITANLQKVDENKQQFTILEIIREVEAQTNKGINLENAKLRREWQALVDAGDLDAEEPELIPHVAASKEFKRIGDEFVYERISLLKNKAEQALKEFPLFRIASRYYGGGEVEVMLEFVNYVFNKRLVSADQVVDTAVAA